MFYSLRSSAQGFKSVNSSLLKSSFSFLFLSLSLSLSLFISFNSAHSSLSYPRLFTPCFPLLLQHKRHAQSNTKYVELIIVADNREVRNQKYSSFYRALNIRVALVGLEVWSDSDKCPVTQDPFTTLHEFLDWRKLKLLPQKPHDNAQLIRSGEHGLIREFGIIDVNVMCVGGGGDHSDNPLGAAVTLAHELGHNFGMNHDTPERGYPFPTVFSSCSKKDLLGSLEKGVGMCLFNMPEVKVLYGGQKCGNGYVEEGEECDCGDLEECVNPCCNSSTCTLKGNAVCAHGQCCEDCQLKPAGTPCRESSNWCDLPEFCTGSDPHCPPNVYLHDGHTCHSVDGHCYNGICQTHEQQCITLWGQDAKPHLLDELSMPIWSNFSKLVTPGKVHHKFTSIKRKIFSPRFHIKYRG
uniref:ADAM metallopeptidase domain 12 n=1 Tax=Astyanax mexicanus TaxID=7994 RepID=A0A3B1IUC8_ASTMX